MGFRGFTRVVGCVLMMAVSHVRDGPRSRCFRLHGVLRLPDDVSPRGRDALLPLCDALPSVLT